MSGVFIDLPANEFNFSALDWQNSVIDRVKVTSVGLTPTIGDRYIIAGVGGAWSTFTIGDIVEYTAGGWENITPNEGFACWDETANELVVFNGATWGLLAGGIAPIGASTDKALVRWNGALGAAVSNSLGVLTDAGALSGLISLTLNNGVTDGGALYFDGVATSYLKSTADGLTLNFGGFTVVDLHGAHLQGGSSPFYLDSTETDGAAAIAFVVNSKNALSNAAAKLLSIQNNSTPALEVDKSGNISLVGTVDGVDVSSLPGSIAAKLDASSFSDAGVTGKLITGFTSGSGAVAGTDTILQALNKLDGNVGTKLDSSAFSDAGVTGKLITGFSSGAGAVAATDTILQAINKLDGNVGAIDSYAGQVIIKATDNIYHNLVGNGSTDNATNWALLGADIVTLSTTQKVILYFPAGDYHFTGTYNFAAAHNIEIVGDGPALTTLDFSSGTSQGIDGLGFNCAVRGMTIKVVDGNTYAIDAGSGTEFGSYFDIDNVIVLEGGIQMTGYNVTIKNTKLYQTGGGKVGFGMRIDTIYRSRLENVYIYGYGYGIWSSGMTNTVLQDVFIDSCGTALTNYGGWSSCLFSALGTYGNTYDLENWGGTNHFSNTMQNCNLYSGVASTATGWTDIFSNIIGCQFTYKSVYGEYTIIGGYEKGTYPSRTVIKGSQEVSRTEANLAAVIATTNDIYYNILSHFPNATRHTAGQQSTSPMDALPPCTTLATAKTLIKAELDIYALHNADIRNASPSYHAAQDIAADYTLLSVDLPTTLEECMDRLADLRSKWNSHEAISSTGHSSVGTVAADQCAESPYVYSTTRKDYIIAVTNTSAGITIRLDTSDVAAGRVIIIKDESGGATAEPITIDTEGAENIDGVGSVQITADYGCVKLYCDGTNWFSL